MSDRTFYRCKSCLVVIATEVRLPNLVGCSVCNSEGAPGAPCFEYMGRVQESRLVKDGIKSICDARCTNASGPECDCQCKGANHGSGMIVQVIIDQGPVPKISTPARADKHRADWKAYVRTCNELHEVCDKAWGGRWTEFKAKRGGYYSGPTDPDHRVMQLAAYTGYAVKKAKSHSHRMKQLNKLLTLLKTKYLTPTTV